MKNIRDQWRIEGILLLGHTFVYIVWCSEEWGGTFHCNYTLAPKVALDAGTDNWGTSIKYVTLCLMIFDPSPCHKLSQMLDSQKYVTLLGPPPPPRFNPINL